MNLLKKMEKIHGMKNGKINCAMIYCRIHITDFGKLIRFKRFSCWSYSELTYGKLTGLMLDKELDVMFHFVADNNYIMIYPVENKNNLHKYNPQSFVDFYEVIKKKIDKNAELLTYKEYQDKLSKHDLEVLGDVA